LDSECPKYEKAVGTTKHHARQSTISVSFKYFAVLVSLYFDVILKIEGQQSKRHFLRKEARDLV
jgi:hypothetical protein